MKQGPIVIKIGGAVAGEESVALADAAALARKGERVVIVHGGGPLVGEWSKRLGLDPRFEEGQRVTDPPTRDVALAVLAGLVNKRLVALLRAHGVSAVGLSGADGGMLEVARGRQSLGLVGEVTGARTDVLDAILATGAVPVVAPAAIDGDGELLNVNADAVAGALAIALEARLLVFVTDVEGVRDGNGAVLPTLDAATVRTLKEKGVISGGMLPKIDACLAAARAGCVAAIVAPRERGTIVRLHGGERVGTVVGAA